MKISKIIIILILIIMVASFLRIFKLNDVPLYGDELTMVYDSYSILKTGHDSTGDFLPLTFKMGAGRPGGYIYFQLPFVAAFGPTVFGERSLSILSGLGLVFFMFLLARRLFNDKIGLFAAALMAISPWGINLSRGGFESNFALMLGVAGVLAFILAKDKPWMYLISAFSWGIAIHTYPTFKVTLPMVLALLVWHQGGVKKIFEKGVLPYVISALSILAVAATLSLIQTFSAGSEARFTDINVFNQTDLQQNLIQQINYERSISALPENIKPFLINKIFENVFVIGQGYLENFSVDFLFMHGDRNPRHNMSVMGEFYLIEIATIIFGLIYLSKKNKRVFIFLIIWAIISPIPTSILLETHALRSSFLLAPLALFSACGLFYLAEISKRAIWRWPAILILVVFLIQFIFFTERLYFLAPNEFGRFWSYPAKMASELAISEKNNFQFIILSDRIDNAEFAYPVYAKIDPEIVILQNQLKTLLAGLTFKKYDNIYIGFVPDGQEENFVKSVQGSVLFIGAADESRNLTSYQILEGTDKLAALVVRKKP